MKHLSLWDHEGICQLRMHTYKLLQKIITQYFKGNSVASAMHNHIFSLFCYFWNYIQTYIVNALADLHITE